MSGGHSDSESMIIPTDSHEMYFSITADEIYNNLTALPTLDRMFRHNSQREVKPKGGGSILDPLTKEEYDIQERIKEAVEHEREVMMEVLSEHIQFVIEKTQKVANKKCNQKLRTLKKTMNEEKDVAVEDARKSAHTEAKNDYDKILQALNERYSEELAVAIERTEKHYQDILNFKIQALHNEMREEYSNRLRIHAREWVAKVTDVKKQHEKHTEETFEKLKVHINKQITKLLWVQKYIFDIEKASRMRDQVDMAIQLLTVIKQKELDLSETDTLLGRAKNHIRGWKEVVIDLVTQFQKFINHFLKETPGSAEYMMDLERIVRRQLDYTELITKQPESSVSCSQSEDDKDMTKRDTPETSQESLASEKELTPEEIVNSIIEWILDKIFEWFDKEVVEEVPEVEKSENVLMILKGEAECPVPAKRKAENIEAKREEAIKILGDYEKENCEEGEFIEKRVKSLMEIIGRNPSVLKYIAPH